MDIQYFALSRVEFVSRFYEKALFPFVEMKRLIEEGASPYESVYSESDEPQFLSEWLDADQSIDILGIQCASLLCSTLKLFFAESLENVFRRNSHKVTKSLSTKDAYDSVFRKEGWLNGYQKLFEKEFKIEFSKSGANLSMVEELILIRNRGQHPECITRMSNNFSKNDMGKIPSPFFIDDAYKNKKLHDFFPPTIKPQPDKMRAAFEESIKLINWLENSLEQWGQDQVSQNIGVVLLD
jgi:hypothetical protein